MRKDVGVDGDAQRISQIVWLLFLKIFDDKEQEWQVTIPNYKSPLQTRYRWSNWAKDAEGITGEELIDFVNNDFFPALKKLATTAGVSPQGRVIGSVFEDAYNYMKSGTLLRQVINTIEADVDFNSSKDRHLFNDIYEKILADLQSAGNAGEYYTPRAVTQFMVDILDPQLGDKILDPACGTGGFLTCTIEHLNKQVKNNSDMKILQSSINGIEKKPLPHMLAMTNMMLHGIDVPTNIRHDNTLSRPLKDYTPKDRVDIIITNPPFGGIEEDGIEKNFPKKFQTRETADLFMALIMHLLRENTGKAAVVLPDGFLFGEGVKTTIKQELLNEFNLHTIVRLPKGVFSPYTNISTNILFFEKGGSTKDVWFFEHPYPEGYKSYSRSKPLTIEEFNLEKKWWGGATRKSRKVTENAWKMSVKELCERNFNFDCKNPHRVAVVHANPDTLFCEYQELKNNLLEIQNELKNVLIQSLEGQQKKILKKHLDIAFFAPNGIKKLRELILTLAMQGKLVPQEPSDRPTREVLKEVSKEKQKLVKDRKIKHSSPLPSITPEEIPYELPNGWEWVRLGEVGLINPRNNCEDDKDVGFVSMPHISAGYSFVHTFQTKKWSEIKKGYTHFQNRDVGLAKITPCFENAKSCVFYDLPNGIGAGTTELHIFRDIYSIVNPRFLLNYLKNPRYLSLGATKMTGSAGQKRVPTDFFSNNPFPLPPIKEQLRIVKKIDQLMQRCDRLEDVIRAKSLKEINLLDSVVASV